MESKRGHVLKDYNEAHKKEQEMLNNLAQQNNEGKIETKKSESSKKDKQKAFSDLAKRFSAQPTSS